MIGCLVPIVVQTLAGIGRLLLYSTSFLVALTDILLSFVFFSDGILMKKFLNPLEKTGSHLLDIIPSLG